MTAPRGESRVASFREHFLMSEKEGRLVDERILLRTDIDGVAVLTMNRPHRRNALDGSLLDALSEGIRRADADSAVEVIVLTGADPAFCAGLDLKELGETGANRRLADTGRGPMPPTVKPMIAAVNGPAVAGGLEVALWCDIIISSTRGSFSDLHAKNGLIPRWGLCSLLGERVGNARAIEMSLTGRPIAAAQALEWGLVSEVVVHEQLLCRAVSLARDIAAMDQRAVRAILAQYRLAMESLRAPAQALQKLAADTWVVMKRESSDAHRT